MTSEPEVTDSGRGGTAKTGRRWLISAFVVFAAALLAVVLSIGYLVKPQSNRMFHGKPESEWIANLKYWDDKQVTEWRGYGKEGIEVLVRGLEDASRPSERRYRRLMRALPIVFRKWMPAVKPDSTHSSRMCIVSLLASLSREDAARIATPIMIRTVTNDEADAVRQSALNFFNSTEDENSLLNKLPPKQKQALLPALLSAVQNPSSWGLRNNAAISLRWYPEKRDVVAPVLVKALQDPQPQVRLLAAEALNRVAPDVAAKTATMSVLVAVARHPDAQVAFRAVNALGHSGSDPAVAVPALVECLQSTNDLIACEAVWALEWAPKEFRSYSNTVISALSATARRKDHVGRYAKNALGRWVPKAEQEK